MHQNGFVQLHEAQPVSTPTPYIERGGDLVAYQPFMQEQTHMRCFFLKGDRDKLQDLCDRVFNRPSGYALNFQPLGSTVLLSFAQIESIYSVNEDSPHLGSMSEIDVAFWIPMLSQRDSGLHLSWYVAYIFVDNPLAMATGREVYGFPKTIAQFQIPKEMNSPESYWVETAALKKFHSQSRMTNERIFEVVPRLNSQQKGKPFQSLNDLRLLLPMLTGGGKGLQSQITMSWYHFRNIAASRKSDILFLRQLRDIRNPAVAAYQEVIEAPARVTDFHRGGWLPGSFDVHLQSNATFPIAEELGLDMGGHPVQAAFWVEFDFLMDVGQTLWRSGEGIRSS
jgi:hypothetical protein